MKCDFTHTNSPAVLTSSITNTALSLGGGKLNDVITSTPFSGKTKYAVADPLNLGVVWLENFMVPEKPPNLSQVKPIKPVRAFFFFFFFFFFIGRVWIVLFVVVTSVWVCCS